MNPAAPPSTPSPDVRTGPARSPVRSSRVVGPLAGLALCAVAALAAAGALSLRLVAVAALRGPGIGAGITSVDAVVELAVLAAGALVAWWLSAGLTAAAVAAAARALGHSWSAGERFVARHAPGVVRRALAVAVGTGVGLASVISAAGAQPAEPPADLNWAVTQAADAAAAPGAAVTAAADAAPSSAVDASAPAPAPPTPAPPTPPPANASPPDGPVTVEPGDSLWRIAADHLPAGAGVAEIAAAWPRVYAANRDVIGADPALIVPGQVLAVPEIIAQSGGQS